nr:MAG TPA: hypothetical protein [Caudoviricetes sp.]
MILLFGVIKQMLMGLPKLFNIIWLLMKNHKLI